MSDQITQPYGSWKSPITTDLIVQGTIGLEQVLFDGPDLYWIETRPTEEGRHVIVRRDAAGNTSDVNPPPINARTRVHEYGGAAYVVHCGRVYFSNFDDQRLYFAENGKAPQPFTPQGECRFANGCADGHRDRLILVCEDHSSKGEEAVSSIVAVKLSGDSEPKPLVAGNDFYSNPRVSPDGKQLAWLTWNHPNMPWDDVELWVGDCDDGGGVTNTRRIAGGENESIFQPEWSPDGVLHFISDRSGWWNLYREREGNIEPLCDKQAEFGQPSWLFGYSTYAFLSPNQILCSYSETGGNRLAVLETDSGKFNPIEIPYTHTSYLRVAIGKAAFVAGSPKIPKAVVLLDLETKQIEVVRSSSAVDVDPGYLSQPEAIEFPTENNQTAHAFYYPPKNMDYDGPGAELPPLLVCSHGGPTGATSNILRLDIQFWTSRGFGVIDVNYGGSTGYGREYRQRLRDKWGIVDVDDCVNGALFLTKRGGVDRNRLAIRGGSAGGFTTLAALVFRDVFAAGASYYGVSDLEALAKETHKFESRYLDGLIGPYPARRDIYQERSPIHHVDGLSCPLILFQGLEDKVVLPNQAEMMLEALRKKGLPVAYVPFEGEQHGFRQAKNIKRALEAELYFYSRVFGFVPADEIEPVEIENLG